MREYNTVEDVLDAVWGIVEFAGCPARPTIKSIGIFGNTPLFAPITWGDANAVRLLLEAGIDCNVKATLIKYRRRHDVWKAHRVCCVAPGRLAVLPSRAAQPAGLPDITPSL